MRLAEFYSLSETKKWTIEHESNGTGRLLTWEEDLGLDDPEDEGSLGSYEVIAKGSVEKLMAALPPEVQEFEDYIRDAWEDAISTGDNVEIIVDETGETHIQMAPKKGDDDDSSYDSNEDELY
jgi:hypothetical protein